MIPTTSYIRKESDQRTTILLVEDEPFVLDATMRILRSAGFDVLAAVDAKEAKQLYEQHCSRIDLVMTDMVLPDRSGRQLAKELRSASPGVSILLTSGYGEAEGEAASLESGTHYLPKPYSRANLVEKIVEITGRPVQRAVKQTG